MSVIIHGLHAYYNGDCDTTAMDQGRYQWFKLKDGNLVNNENNELWPIHQEIEIRPATWDDVNPGPWYFINGGVLQTKIWL